MNFKKERKKDMELERGAKGPVTVTVLFLTKISETKCYHWLNFG